MSREIEEMAKIMCQDAGTKKCNITCSAKPICDVHFYAERLYKHGYRKKVNEECKMQVKIFFEAELDILQDKINEFLRQKDIEVLDITSHFRGYGVMIAYKEK